MGKRAGNPGSGGKETASNNGGGRKEGKRVGPLQQGDCVGGGDTKCTF